MSENSIRINNDLVKAEIRGSNEIIFKIAEAIVEILTEFRKKKESEH